MDHRGLICAIFLMLSFALTLGCAKQSGRTSQSGSHALSVLESNLPSERAFRLCEHFLEYEKGYQLSVRDRSRGLIVTGWSSEGLERHQITLRIAPQVEGSVITAHLRTEVIEAGRWNDLPSVGDREALFLQDLNQYLARRPTP